MSMLSRLLDDLSGQPRLSHREIMYSAVSALVAIAAVVWISYQFLSNTDLPFMIASMGASAVLLFAVPSSPMNRPWVLAAAHVFCALIGITCTQLLPNALLAAPIAIAFSLLAMHYLRCLHPPGGATALLMVLGSPELIAEGYKVVIAPVALNTLVLLLMALLIRQIVDASNNKREVRMPTHWLRDSPHRLDIKPPFKQQDIHAALSNFGSYVDINAGDLLELYRLASQHRYQRELGDLRCLDLMIADPVVVEYGTTLEEAWASLEQSQLTALPVIDRVNHVIGMVSVDDFIRHANVFELDSLEARIEALITYTTELTSEKPEVVGQIMSSDVISAERATPLIKLLPEMDEKEIHHIPVLDDLNKLVGVVSRDEVVAFLEQSQRD